MATEKQIAANRRNAQKSTGPRTPRGKAAIRLNNLRHGLRSSARVLPGEDLKQLAQIRREYLRAYRPQTAEQMSLVDQMASAEWKLLYWKRTETELLSQAFGPGLICQIGTLDRVSQRQVRYERAYLAAYHQFKKLTKAKPANRRPAAR